MDQSERAVEDSGSRVAGRQPAPRGRVQTFRALRHRDYRVYWSGFLVSIVGWQMQFVALGWLVIDLTGSPLDLGFMSGSQAVATIGFSLIGGVVADRMDRRRIIQVAQLGAATCAAILALLVALDAIELWHIIVIAFAFGSFQAFDQPSRQALLPHLVPREDLMNAVALSSAVWQTSRIVGPSIAGILIATVGVAACFALTAMGFLTFVVAVALIRVTTASGRVASKVNLSRELFSGFRHIGEHPLYRTLVGLSFFNAVFGLSYVVLMPAFAIDVLTVGPGGLGALYSASGIGALAGTLLVASLGDHRHKASLVVWGALGFGSLLVTFSLITSFPISLAVLVIMGASTSLYMTTAATMMQERLDDRYRGRVMGIYGLTWSLMPLGGLQAGAIASVWGVQTAIGIGGIAVVASALVLARTRSRLVSPRTASAA
jgi:MFS family permease